MGIPLGHKLKIIKSIKDIRSEKGMTLPQSRNGNISQQIEKVDMITETAQKPQNNEDVEDTAYSQKTAESTQKSSLKEGP